MDVLPRVLWCIECHSLSFGMGRAIGPGVQPTFPARAPLVCAAPASTSSPPALPGARASAEGKCCEALSWAPGPGGGVEDLHAVHAVHTEPEVGGLSRTAAFGDR